jgi:hypothetical protein
MKLIIFFALCISYVLATHYRAHDHVGIVANTVGPFNNPTETYPVRLMVILSSYLLSFWWGIIPFTSQFYSLPFCSGTGKQRRHKQDLGETLSGSRKVATPYDVTFLDPVPWRSLCEEYLDPEDVRVIKFAFYQCSPSFFETIFRSKPSKMLSKMITFLKC